MNDSWLQGYEKYIVGFQVLGTNYESELCHLCIIFSFPNGYSVRLEFESDLFNYEEHAINIHVEMLDKNGMQYTEKAFEEARSENFPNRHREQFVMCSEVEEFLERVKTI